MRTASAMRVLAILRTAEAASSALTPSGAPSFPAKIAARSARDTPFETELSLSGFILPRSRLASEMVGSVPPRP